MKVLCEQYENLNKTETEGVQWTFYGIDIIIISSVIIAFQLNVLGPKEIIAALRFRNWLTLSQRIALRKAKADTTSAI